VHIGVDQRDVRPVRRTCVLGHLTSFNRSRWSHTRAVDYRHWADLTEEARDEDRTFVRELPALLADEDLAIIR
jgi:hypothetical protein